MITNFINIQTFNISKKNEIYLHCCFSLSPFLQIPAITFSFKSERERQVKGVEAEEESRLGERSFLESWEEDEEEEEEE